MAIKKAPQINAGSMADISFLMLIFFLVTTTMNTDTGITRKLPPWSEGTEQEGDRAKARNVLMVLINKDNQLAVEGELTDVSILREEVKDFYLNLNENPNLSEGTLVADKIQEAIDKGSQKDADQFQLILDEFGNVKITKGIVSLQNDRGTKYGKYIEVQNEIVGAINDLRNEIAMQTYGSSFDDCTAEQQDLIQIIYPLSISEAEPKSIVK